MSPKGIAMTSIWSMASPLLQRQSGLAARSVVVAAMLVASPGTVARKPANLPDGFPKPGQPRVVVQVAGAKPQRVMRFAPRATRLTAGITHLVRHSGQPEEHTIPTKARLTLKLTPKKGGADLAGELSGLSYEVPAGADPAFVEWFKSDTKSRTARPVAVGVTRSGVVRPDPVSYGTEAFPLRAFVPTLPREAIGVGARWEVRTLVQYRDSWSTHIVQYELKELTRNGGRVGWTLKYETSEATEPVRGPDGANMRSLGGSGTGSGEACFSLRNVVCGQSTAAIELGGSVLIDGKESTWRTANSWALSVVPTAP